MQTKICGYRVNYQAKENVDQIKSTAPRFKTQAKACGYQVKHKLLNI